MQELLELIKSLNIEPEQLQHLVQTAQQDPFAAMGMVQKLGLSPEVLQKIMMAAMANPEVLVDLAKQFGADDTMLKTVENGLSMLTGRNKES